MKFVNLTMFKSGTHLVRKILKELTGLNFYEPLIAPGINDYEDESKFYISEIGYFSWHLFPGSIFNAAVKKNGLKSVYLVRNLFDQLLSARDHFLKNIDVEIGRGSYVGAELSRLSDEELANFFVHGGKVEGLHWRGVLHQHKHMQMLFASAASCNSLIVTYENLVLRRSSEVSRIADYLNIENYDVQDLVQSSDLSSMREVSLNKSHFNVGKVGRIFDEENKRYRKLLERSSQDFNSFSGYGYLTNLDDLKKLVQPSGF